MWRKRRCISLGGLRGILPDSMQLNAADPMVPGEVVSAPTHHHGGLEEVGSARLQCDFLSQTIAHCQLPAHIHVPGETGQNDVS